MTPASRPNLDVCPLFTQSFPDERLDEGYLFLRDSPGCEEARADIGSMWTTFEPLADKHFIGQFALSFEARAWEMRLGCALLAAGHEVSSSEHGPDFEVQSSAGGVYVEAVACTPNAGDRAFSERLRTEPRWAGAHSDDGLLPQLTGVMSAKMSKWARYVDDDVVEPRSPYVIAINSGQIPMAWCEDPMKEGTSLPAIAKVLFGIGTFTWSLEVETGDVAWAGRGYRPELIKGNGASIDAEAFRPDGARDLSAIIYTTQHFGARPSVYGNPPGSDLRVIHNPSALEPLPTDFFGLGSVFEVQDGVLVQVLHWSNRAPQRDSAVPSPACGDIQ